MAMWRPATIVINVDDDTPDAVDPASGPTEMEEPGTVTFIVSGATFDFTGTSGQPPVLNPNLLVNAGSVVAHHYPDSTLQGPPVSAGAQPIVFTAAAGSTFAIGDVAIGLFGATQDPLRSRSRATTPTET